MKLLKKPRPKSKTIKSSRKPKKIFIKVAFLVFTIVLVVLLGVYCYKSITIKEVICQDSFGNCSDMTYKKLSSVKGATPLEAKSAVTKILKEENVAEAFQVNYVFPYKLKVFIENRTVVYSISGKSDWLALVDSGGVVVDLVDQSSLPTISTERDLPNIGKVVNDEILFSLNLVDRISKISQVETSVMTGNSLLISLKDEHIKFIFPTEGDAAYMAGALNLTLSRLNNPDKETTIEKSEIREIDFRYKNPVMRKN